jgi:hypothetical protein
MTHRLFNNEVSSAEIATEIDNWYYYQYYCNNSDTTQCD